MKATETLHDRGQSLWLDNITRDLLETGTLARYIKELSVTGLTSNPTIFPRQGQYARDAKSYPPADLTVERIGDLLTNDLPDLLSLEVPR